MTPKKKTTATIAAEGEASTATAATNTASAEIVTDTAIEALTTYANLAPATEVDTSGSPQQIVPDVDLNHPAVDSNPRSATSVAQNRIDFNDPTISGQEAVERNLGINKA